MIHELLVREHALNQTHLFLFENDGTASFICLFGENRDTDLLRRLIMVYSTCCLHLCLLLVEY